MSPEQVQGEHATARSDVFAFGTVLHEMLSGTGHECQASTRSESQGKLARAFIPRSIVKSALQKAGLGAMPFTLTSKMRL